MAYRIFTTEDLKGYHDARGYIYANLSAPYRCINWNIFWNDYGPPGAGLDIGVTNTARQDYVNNPTKLMLRRHVVILGVDSGTPPDV